ncbi:MAG: two-partner secretion domain-containing protein [Hydrogenophaga sp.]|uniref:two-partner secretion domain-containing protein n=1 Tax=Hydrogenophaga sp. TaxID=1904254 RepID=UPI0040358145
MNRIYTTIWNHAINAWTVVSEVASARGKRGASRVAGALLLAPLAAVAGGLPTGGTVTAGQGSLQQAGNVLTIQQASDKLAIDWNSFSIGQGHSVNFVQPGAASVALNRVLGPDVSVIQGALNANGQVFLVNPNGVLFSPTAQVNVGSLVASTLNISTEDFLASRYHFSGDSAAAIVNQGQISAASGGHVALVAARIVNDGQLSAERGSVVLAAGSTVRLDLGGPVQVEVDGGALGALIDNGGAIHANGGTVLMTARAIDSLTATVINSSGLIEARSLGVGADGVVSLVAEQGGVHVSGRIDVSAPQGQAGKAIVTGDTVTIADGAVIDATGATGGGQIYVGGSWQGKDNRIKQAHHTVVASGALLDASATQNGHGGTVVAWSDIHAAGGRTEVAGVLKARGGAQGGNGGRIETSGATLSVSRAADAAAPKGNGGLWLIDPTNVTIAAGAGAIGGTNVGLDDIETALAGGTNVSIQADDTITWTSDYTNTGGSGRSLILSADQLVLQGNIGSTSDLSFIFNGDVKLDGHITIASQGGEIYFAKYVDSATAGAGNASRLTLTNTGTGSIVFGDQVGGTNPLASLYVTTAPTGATHINGGIVRTFGEQVYDSPVVLGAAEFLNAGFENGTTGWSIHDQRVYMNGGSTVRGYLTPNDPSGPATSSGENVSSSGTFTSGVSNNGANGTQGLQLSSIQQCATGYCIVRGGYVTSDSTIALAKGDVVSFQWNAAGSSDAYDVFGYLLNVKTGETQVILNATGANAWSSTGWQTASTTVETAGTYAFVFVSGSWDASGGRALGATLTLDNISTTSLFNGKTLEGSSLSFLQGMNAADNKLTLKADEVNFGGTVSGTGQIGFEALNPGHDIHVGGGAGTPGDGVLNVSSATLASLADGFSSINIGGAAMQGNIVVVTDTRLQDSVDLNAGTGHIRLDAVLGSTDMVTLQTDGGTVTQAGNATLEASTLALVGNGGQFTLGNAGNTVGTLVTDTQDVHFVNSGALAIGSATLADGSTLNGIHNTGLVNVSTVSGDIALGKSVQTSSTASNAIVLNAGASQSAGQATGGNVTVGAGATVGTGAGGRAVIYTGSVAGSTGVTGAVGSGSGRFRYNSDESTSNFTKALGDSGVHAVYREQPVLTVSTNGSTKLEADNSGVNGFDGGGAEGYDVQGLLNGDTKAMLGDPRYTTDAAGPGKHAIRISLLNELGYAVVNSTENAEVEVTLPFNPASVTDSIQRPSLTAVPAQVHVPQVSEPASAPDATGGLQLVQLAAEGDSTTGAGTQSASATDAAPEDCAASGWTGSGCGASAQVLVRGSGLRLPNGGH